MYWDELSERLRENSARMKNSIKVILDTKKEELRNLKESYAFRQPMNYINQLKQTIDECTRQMQNYLQNMITIKKHTFQNLIGKLEALSPLAILGRGYSITFDANGHPIVDVAKVKKGTMIKTRVTTGTIESEVKKTEELK